MQILSSQDQHFLKAVLSPSWLSGLLAVLLGLIVTIGSIVTFSLRDSALKQDLIGWEQSHTVATASASNQSLVAAQPTFANSWSLIVVWALVGVFTYVIAVWLVSFMIKSIEFNRELHYVHANARSMVETAIGNIAMRIIAAAMLGISIALFIYHILPNAIRDDRIISGNLLTLHNLHFAVISFISVTFWVYIGTILLRLSLGRGRIFSSN